MPDWNQENRFCNLDLAVNRKIFVTFKSGWLVWLPSFWLLDLSCLKRFASFCINVKYLLPLPGFKVEVSRVSTEMAL